MNTRTIALALFTATASIAFAQDATPPATATPQTETYHEKLVRELGLTADQLAQIEKIEAQHRENAKELNRANLDTPTRQERARVLRDNKEMRIKAVLSAEQYDKYVALRKTKHDGTQERNQQMQGGHQE